MIYSFEYRGQSYEFDDQRMGLGEARWVKQETGLFGTAFYDAIRNMDPDAMACLVVIGMRRGGLTETDLEDVCADENGYFELIETIKPVEPETPSNRTTRRAAARKKDTTVEEKDDTEEAPRPVAAVQ